MSTSIESVVRTHLLSDPEVVNLDELRRSSIVFAQGQAADAIFFLSSGLAKLTRTNVNDGRIILAIRGAGDLIGEEAFASASGEYNSEAEVILPSIVHRIPRTAIDRVVADAPELALALLSYVAQCRNSLGDRVELLCLHDVEYRVLHALERLSSVVGISRDGAGCQIPITQLELADMIGATRETTSTVLNQLERRDLVHLSRRMLTVRSPEALRRAMQSDRAETAPMAAAEALSPAAAGPFQVV